MNEEAENLGTHAQKMQFMEAMGFNVVPGFCTLFCFGEREAAIEECRKEGKIITLAYGSTRRSGGYEN